MATLGSGALTARERLASIAFIVLIASLTLEWMALGSLAGGRIKIFHLVAIGFIGIYLSTPHGLPSVVALVRRKSAVWYPLALYLLMVGASVLAQRDPYYQPSELPRQLFYAFTGAVIAGFTFVVLPRAAALRWTAPVVVTTIVVALSGAVVRRGDNPIAIVGEAASKADPTVLSTMFRAAFRSQGIEDVGVNLRHKVFAAVLIGMWLTVATVGRKTAARRNVLLRAAVPLSAALVILSLSRSLALALALAWIVAALRPLVSGHADRRSLSGLALAGFCLISLVFTPVGGLLQTRFLDETSSYSARADAVSGGFIEQFGNAAAFGASASEVERSPHNLILDAWLSGGVLAWIGATVFFVAYLRIVGREVLRYLDNGRWTAPVEHLAVIGMGALPLVRAFTAGAGLHLTDWVAIGLVLGITEVNRVAARSEPTATFTSPQAAVG